MSPQDQAAKNKALQSMAAMSSAQIVSATTFHSKMALARGPGYPAISGVSGAAHPLRGEGESRMEERLQEGVTKRGKVNGM